MKKFFEEPVIDCVKIVSESITESGGGAGGEFGVTSGDPFNPGN